MEEQTILGLLALLGGDFLAAIKKIVGVAIVGVVVLFVAERTLIKRHIVSEVLPMWSMLMAYFLTMKGRLSEIERISGDALVRLDVLAESSGENKEHRFGTEMWKESATGSIRHELKRCLQESRLSTDETLNLFALVKSALLKLKNDTELFRAYSNHLSSKITSLWSEKLHVLNAVGGGVESVQVVSKEAEALDFYIARHLDIFLLYLESYVAGDRDDVVCENLANYWPYFLGQTDRLLATARKDFLREHLGERERKTLTLRGRVQFIEEALAETREEIGQKINKDLPEVEAHTIWGR
jgi:hypothetical protein